MQDDDEEGDDAPPEGAAAAAAVAMADGDGGGRGIGGGSTLPLLGPSENDDKDNEMSFTNDDGDTSPRSAAGRR